MPSHVPNDPIQVGTMFFSVDAIQPYWWDGGTWVTYAPPPSVTISGTPSDGQVPTATSGTTATWQNPTLDGTVTLSGTASVGYIPTATSATTATWQAPNSAYVQAYTSNQSTNLGAGDHITFDSSLFTQGTDISLDTTSPYTTTLGQPSIGRITLAPGHSYKLVATLVQVSGSGNILYQWANASTGGNIGRGARLQNVSGDFDAPAQCVAFITVSSSPVLIELQIAFNNGITSIGENAAAPLYPWFTAEEID